MPPAVQNQVPPQPAKRAPTFRFYVYPLQFTSMVAGTQQTLTVKVDAKYRFAAYGVAALNYNPTTGLYQTTFNGTLRWSDSASGRYWSNAAVPLIAVSGFNNEYYRWTVPRVVEKNARIQCDMVPNVLTAGFTDLWVCLIGAQIAEYN